MDQLCRIRVPSSGPHLILLSPLMALFWGERHCWRLSLWSPNSSITAYTPGLTLCSLTVTLAVRSFDVQILRGSSIPNNDVPLPMQ